MFFTTAATPFQKPTRCQKLGYQQPTTSYANTLGFEDLLDSLTRVAYEEELARREKIANDLKRKRIQQEQQLQRRRENVVRQFEEDEFYQIQIFKQRPNKNNFKSYQIQYFKKHDELILRISSEFDQFVKNYKFDANEVDEKNIDYKILDNKVLIINVPKKQGVAEFASENIFNFLLHQQRQVEEARLREQLQQRLREQQLQQQRIREQQLQQQRVREQQQKLLLLRQQQLAAKREVELKRQREEQLKLQQKRQESLQLFFNSFLQNEVGKQQEQQQPYISINGFQIPISSTEDNSSLEDSEEEIEESDTDQEFAETPSTPEFSDVEDQDPDVSDISQLLESNVIKPVSSNVIDSSSSEAEVDNEDDNEHYEEESLLKKRRLRSPSIEEVEDEEFLRWK